MSRSGFTLVEALIVVGILTLMTSFLLLHNRATGWRIALLNEKAALIGVFLRAKNLTSGTLIERTPAGEAVCGYGVHLDSEGYLIYRDLAADCAASDYVYSGRGSGEELAGGTVKLLANIHWARKDVDDILFTPPLTDVFFDGQKATGEAAIILADKENNAQAKIIINIAGQINEE